MMIRFNTDREDFLDDKLPKLRLKLPMSIAPFSMTAKRTPSTPLKDSGCSAVCLKTESPTLKTKTPRSPTHLHRRKKNSRAGSRSAS